MGTLGRILSNAKIFALKVLGAFGYKPNHPTTLEEIIFEEQEEVICEEQEEVICGEPEKSDYAPIQRYRRKRSDKAENKNSILNDLDRYFRLLKKMKTADNLAYDFYKKIGGQIVTDFQFDGKEIYSLPPRWKKDRPAFGCILCTNGIHKSEKQGAESKVYTPQMLYFTRFEKSPLGVQVAPDGYDIYKVSAHWYEKGNFNFVTDMCFGIDPDNNVHMLFTKIDDTAVFYSKRIGAPGKERQVVSRQKWGVHEFYKEWAAEHDVTPETLLVSLFCYTVHFYEASNMSGMIEVKARKNNLVGRFMLQPQDAAYMFKDRERIGNTRKHIFHSVVPHTRTVNGKEKNIKLHFRGQRDFYWNGYQINIVVPIRETVLYMPEVDFKAVDADDPENKHRLKNSIEGGAELADFLLKIDRGEHKRSKMH